MVPTMPRWLQGMVVPTAMLWLYMLVLSFVWGYSTITGRVPVFADLASRFAFALIVSSWVIKDAQKRGLKLCYDYGMFVFWAWPIVVPVYLFQSRGWKGVYTLFWFGGLCLIFMLLTFAWSYSFRHVSS